MEERIVKSGSHGGSRAGFGTVFVTATDTDAGKTYVSGHLCRALRESSDLAGRVGYYKAAISGASALEDSDAGFVRRIGGLEQETESMTPYLFKEPLSPHLAAERAGAEISADEILRGFAAVRKEHDTLLFEGTGGLFCPLSRKGDAYFTILDLMRRLDGEERLSVVLIGPSGLGAINQIMCGFECLLSAGFDRERIVIVMNRFRDGDFMHEDNRRVIRDLSRCAGVFTLGEGRTGEGIFDSREFLLTLEKSARSDV